MNTPIPDMVPNTTPHQRSFVRREGRVTEGQVRAIETLWPTYGLTPVSGVRWDFDTIFGRSAPKVLEIGFGNGESFVSMARHSPGRDFIGIEVYRTGIGRTLAALHQANIPNARLVMMDASLALSDHIAHCSLNEIKILFPDPWPKKRHHKRRFIQAETLALLVSRLRPQGFLHIATDWEDYARHITCCLESEPLLIPVGHDAIPDGVLCPRSVTRFEQRGRDLGHDIHEFFLMRSSQTPIS